MNPRWRQILLRLKGTPFHPQWLTDRYHRISRSVFSEIKDAVIIDIGSGSSRHASLDETNNQYLRLDYPETNLRYDLPPDIHGDACRLPIAPASADVVFLLEVLEHLPCPEQALKEIQGTLKSGGKLYLSVPFVYPVHDAPFDYRRFTLHGIRRLLADSGLHPVREIQHGNSLLVGLQLINLALLEIAQRVLRTHTPLGLVTAVLFYPICMLVNLIASPFLKLNWPNASCFGYFIIAERA